MDKNCARVYSYLRFSDPRQSAGASLARQTEFAEKWAATNGMALDGSLTLRDEGLSAYHQKHVTQGALGVFLRAVEDGRIAAGSVLIVEGLDRLSRAEPIQAQAQLAQIVNAGITVVTASDGKSYNREQLKAQPMDLVYSLLVMIRAHEESDTKSRRVKDAVRRQCLQWQAGTFRGRIVNGKDPQWLEWRDERWHLIPERVEAVRHAIALYRKGEGAAQIMRQLAEQGMSYTSSQHLIASHFYKLIRLPALYGDRELEVDGEAYALAGYYPPIMSKADWDGLQLEVSGRMRKKGKGDIPGVITGLGILHCGYCGCAMVAQNLNRAKPGQKPAPGHRRIICVGTSHGQRCTVNGSISVVPVENALMRFAADQFNLSALLSGADLKTPLLDRLASTQTRVAQIAQQLERLTEAMLADSDAVPLVFMRKARELEQEQQKLQAIATDTERELAELARHHTPAMAGQWAALVEGVADLDYDARMQARKLVADTYQRITVHIRGIFGEPDAPYIDVILSPRGVNTTRLIRIDRKTGEWRSGEELDV
ncbi:recombinase family protein [Chitinibacteraceae bacterium HSL-7]